MCHKATAPHSTNNTPQKCNKPRCTICQHYLPNDYFQSTVTRHSFLIRHPFTCNSNNIIYFITCLKCKKQYVGQTSKTLRNQINQPRLSIKTKQPRYISKHFNLEGHSVNDLKVQIIDTSTLDNLESLEQF